MKLTEFEERIVSILLLNEKDARRMDRVLSDLTNNLGMGKSEILEFIQFGAEKELSDLAESYDWEKFRRSISKKLVK